MTLLSEPAPPHKMVITPCGGSGGDQGRLHRGGDLEAGSKEREELGRQKRERGRPKLREERGQSVCVQWGWGWGKGSVGQGRS